MRTSTTSSRAESRRSAAPRVIFRSLTSSLTSSPTSSLYWFPRSTLLLHWSSNSCRWSSRLTKNNMAQLLDAKLRELQEFSLVNHLHGRAVRGVGVWFKFQPNYDLVFCCLILHWQNMSLSKPSILCVIEPLLIVQIIVQNYIKLTVSVTDASSSSLQTEELNKKVLFCCVIAVFFSLL